MSHTTLPPFISICIASYNYAQYLQRGFEAIQRQTFRDFEIIYVDDASSDSSVEVIRQLIRTNPDMRITLKTHTQNEGLLATKTELLRLASGTYVMLCDADDWMADHCLQKLADHAKLHNADRIISQVTDIDPSGRVLQIQDFAECPSKWLWNLHHGCLYKREIIERNHLKMDIYPDDVCLTTKFNLHCKYVEWVKEPLYYWYVHPASAGRKKKVDETCLLGNFHQLVTFIQSILSQLSNPRERDVVLLLLIKLYYLQLFHEIKECRLIDQLRLYHKLHRHMQRCYPDYLKNSFLRYNAQAPVRKYALRIMKLGKYLETFHLMLPALIGYWFLRHWIVFDQ